jgi:tetratricopeptide (TPR) repeat protein
VRILNIFTSYMAYIGKMIWPLDLAIFYPYPEKIFLVKILGAFFILVLITVFVIYKLKALPYLSVGWFWYLGTLVPVIGLLKIGGMAIADRYSYIPLIGIFIMIAWGMPQLLKNWRHKAHFLSFLAGAVLLVLTVLAWIQTSYWKNNVLLFEHALRVTRNNYIAHNVLGSDLVEKGLFQEAYFHFKRSLEIWPEQDMIRNNLGFTLIQLGREDEAIVHLKKILKTDKNNYYVHFNLGIAFAKKRNFDEAIHHFQEVLKIDPHNWAAHRLLAFSLRDSGREKEAIHHFQEALRINPSDKIAERELRRMQEEEAR